MTGNGGRFYVTGGTLNADAPSYVVRDADAVLYDELVSGNLCYVLTARQMGKSSLMVRTAVRLREGGHRVAVLDLTAMGRNVSPEQWYAGLLSQLGQDLDLEGPLLELWTAQSRFGAFARWREALRRVVLARSKQRVVLFLDEIDVVRSLPFSTDELFAGIRELYNHRTHDTDLQRLGICLLGVASPSDLVKDTRITPFNLGRRIELHDFSAAEAAPLARGLGREEKLAAALLRRVLHWTGGHPYLTQRLCSVAAEDASVTTARDVDRLCRELYFSARGRALDPNLQFVRDRMLRTEQSASLLTLYGQILGRRPIRETEGDGFVTPLRLCGIAKVTEGRLEVRNRIYKHVFDREWVRSGMPDAEVRRLRAIFRRRLVATTVVAVLLGILIGGALVWVRYAGKPPQVRADAVRFDLPIRGEPYEAPMSQAFDISRDGTRLAYSAIESGRSMVYVRRLDSLQALPVAGTEGGDSPFISPDGAWLGFAVDGKLKKVPITGGVPSIVCEIPRPGVQGATWSRNGWIVFADTRGLRRVRDVGGVAEIIRTNENDSYWGPQMLPGETDVLFHIRKEGLQVTLAVVPLSGGTPKHVLDHVQSGRYLAPGYLVYMAQGWLNAVQFDFRRLETQGAPFKLPEGSGEFERTNPQGFRFSETGTLVYPSPGGKFRPVWVSRDGKTVPLPVPADAYHHPVISPDERRFALTRGDDIYVYSLDGAIPVRITAEHPGQWPIWTPDGERIAYASIRDDGHVLCWKRADGSGPEEVLVSEELDQAITCFTDNGKSLIFGRTDPFTNTDHWRLRVDGKRKAEPLLSTDFREGGAKVSPDGNWVAYHSDRSGKQEVWVTGLNKGGTWQISDGGGREPLWSRNGRELFYRTQDGRMMAVSVRMNPFTVLGKPTTLFTGDYRKGGMASYDVTGDGKHFLMVQPLPDSSPRSFRVVLNWRSELEAQERITK